MSSSSTATEIAAHARDAAQLARTLQVDAARGLSADEAARRLRRDGPNALPQGPRRGWLSRLRDQLADFMIVVLLGAAALSALVGDALDALAIGAIVALNAAIGVVQEWRADRALRALRRFATLSASVLRDARAQRIDAHQLVVGDIVLLDAGDMVPADLRLLQVAQLAVDESALSGESVAVHKHTAPLPQATLALGDRANMAWRGTLVVAGRGRGIVVGTGARTELGRMAALVRRAPGYATPLQRRLGALGRRLSLLVLAICGALFVLGVARGEPWVPMALTAVSLAVAAIPEALPAVVSVVLALGARAMARHAALVRRLAAVEALGAVTVICSDKTGTLTVNRMRVEATRTWDALPDDALWQALVLCNDAVAGAQGGWIGDPMEVALLEAAARAGVDIAALRAARPRRVEFAFDAQRRRMTTVHPDGWRWQALTKGAPESVLPRCGVRRGLHGVHRFDVDAVQRAAHALAAQGMRVLAVAERHWDAPPPGDVAAVERDLCLLGLVALRDPPRPEARAAVAACHAAGIRAVMITGDHAATARAIAAELGFGLRGAAPVVLDGSELAALDDAALRAAVPRVQVFARMDPVQKIRIVDALQQRGDVVAMTGDGVNDAPALRRADVGVAMGRGGTDVAREAAGLILLDDHFATIVAAVREGRRIVDNLRKFLRYALAGNLGEIGAVALAPLCGMPLPLLPVQILWVNLVTDGLPGLAFGAEAAEPDVMRRGPRSPRHSLLAGATWQQVLGAGALIAALCLALQAWAVDVAHGRTMVFTTLTLSQLGHALAIRVEHAPWWRARPWSNPALLGAVALTAALQLLAVYLPALQRLLHTVALSPLELALCAGGTLLVAAAVEADRALRRRARG